MNTNYRPKITFPFGPHQGELIWKVTEQYLMYWYVAAQRNKPLGSIAINIAIAKLLEVAPPYLESDMILDNGRQLNWASIKTVLETVYPTAKPELRNEILRVLRKDELTIGQMYADEKKPPKETPDYSILTLTELHKLRANKNLSSAEQTEIGYQLATKKETPPKAETEATEMAYYRECTTEELREMATESMFNRDQQKRMRTVIKERK